MQFWQQISLVLVTAAAVSQYHSGRGDGRGGGFDPREARAGLFADRESAPPSAGAATSPTLAKWARRPSATATVANPPSAGPRGANPRGARISLVSYSPSLDVAVAVDTLAIFSSVKEGDGTKTCSTDNSGAACSVNAPGDKAGGNCSTSGDAGKSFCSSGKNGDNDAAKLGCSTSGKGTGGGACSAGAKNTTCSTNANTDESGRLGNCSSGGGLDKGPNQTCSVGAQAGGDKSGDTKCSSFTPAGGDAKGATCSVSGPGSQDPGKGNSCSTDGGANQQCSAMTAKGFCSIQPDQQNVACTVMSTGSPDSTSKCSAFGDAQKSQCSVAGATDNADKTTCGKLLTAADVPPGPAPPPTPTPTPTPVGGF